MFQKQQQHQKQLAAVWALLFAAALSYCADASPLQQQQSAAEVANWSRLRREANSKKPSKGFEAECLRAHNKWRRLHQADDLVFDKKIAAFAQKRADFIAESDGAEFRHPPDLTFGENLAWHSRPSKSCADLVKMWYDEVELYDFVRAQFSHETGHFTQLVWRDTKRVGCAKSISSGPRGGVYLVCNYDPPGNYLGEARENVLERVTPPVVDRTTTTTTVATPPVPSSTTSTTTTSTTTTTTIAPPTSRSPAEVETTTKRPNSDKKKNKKNKKGKKKNKKGDKNKDKKKNKKNKGRPNGGNSINKKQKLEDQTQTTTTTTTLSPKNQQ